ncbi:cobyrinic acid ac-diamide synthase [Tepidicaulis marinus]|uniref:Chromosome partitioning protein ParA n=2 Tax=Tepidicaulis marinus TaxID=1333998 RepID=A0A081B6N0_9HYPH|nr:cobyrinic acid ac-diamide synthase [Tepidicaulis marinus]
METLDQNTEAPASTGKQMPDQGVKKPRVLVLANQKGGVGKTTTAINLGTALAAVGERVLIVDLDPQGNASTGLGIDRQARKISTYDVLIGSAVIEDAIVSTQVPGLDVAPSTMDLLGAELELASVARRSHRLRDALNRMPPAGRAPERDASPIQSQPYSYVLIDCPPSLNLLTINAMTAADAILVPLQCEFFALEGLSQLLRTVERVRSSLNPKLEIQGIVLTMFDKRNNLSGQVAEDVRAYLGDKVYKTVIPRNVRISEAPSYGKPALVYDFRCSGSQAYMRLASEIIQREQKLRNRPAA